MPKGNFSFTDSTALKSATVKHEVGVSLTISFCGNCGTALCKTAGGNEFGDVVICFAGVVDDDGKTLGTAPQAELWTKYRLDWVGKGGDVGMKQFEGFP